MWISRQITSDVTLCGPWITSESCHQPWSIPVQVNFHLHSFHLEIPSPNPTSHFEARKLRQRLALRTWPSQLCTVGGLALILQSISMYICTRYYIQNAIICMFIILQHNHCTQCQLTQPRAAMDWCGKVFTFLSHYSSPSFRPPHHKPTTNLKSWPACGIRVHLFPEDDQSILIETSRTTPTHLEVSRQTCLISNAVPW